MTPEAPRNCRRCSRLVAYRAKVAAKNPDWFNGAVESFGDPAAELLVVGLAPGVSGANRTGRPFTGDHAGGLLYSALTRYGWANDRFDARPDDGLRLTGAMVTNAVRCAPPGNKPTGAEAKACRDFLADRIAALPRLRALICLGVVSHQNTVRALGGRVAAYPFAHGARHTLGAFAIWDSYHCSRYNTNTGRLTPEMFHKIFANVRAALSP